MVVGNYKGPKNPLNQAHEPIGVHAILAVGYDTDENGEEYWLIKKFMGFGMGSQWLWKNSPIWQCLNR